VPILDALDAKLANAPVENPVEKGEFLVLHAAQLQAAKARVAELEAVLVEIADAAMAPLPLRGLERIDGLLSRSGVELGSPGNASKIKHLTNSDGDHTAYSVRGQDGQMLFYYLSEGCSTQNATKLIVIKAADLHIGDQVYYALEREAKPWTIAMSLEEIGENGPLLAGSVTNLDLTKHSANKGEVEIERPDGVRVRVCFGPAHDVVIAARPLVTPLSSEPDTRNVTDADIAAAGLGDPSICEDSAALCAWLAANEFEVIRFGNPGDLRAGIWRKGCRTLPCSPMAHDWIINALAGFVNRPPLVVLGEIAAMAHQIIGDTVPA
jgi:hypothetical protein